MTETLPSMSQSLIDVEDKSTPDLLANVNESDLGVKRDTNGAFVVPHTPKMNALS